MNELILLYIKAIVLGLVEGATEFIPVSSTGHLILAADWLNFHGEAAKTFEVFIQLGAILAVAWLYREKFMRVARNAYHAGEERDLVLNLIIASIPAVIVGFLLRDWIKATLFDPKVVAVALVLGGFVILLVERWNPPDIVEDVDRVPRSRALGVGLAQLLSLIPGVSRSGATIIGGRALGLSRTAATEFSFFLAVPIMFGATLYDLWKSRDVLSVTDIPVFAVGFLISFISAIFVIRALLAYVKGHDFRGFAWYRIVFGAILMLVYF